MWYFYNLFISLDQLANTLYGGWPDETISARAYREQWKMEKWIDLLFWYQKHELGHRNHCQQAYWHEQDRRDLPPEYRRSCKEHFVRKGQGRFDIRKKKEK